VGYRRRLIEAIRAKGIEDLELLQYFDRVPRHHFLPQGVLPRAYEDAPLPIGYGQTASQPSLQALYLQVLRPEPHERVLEIGTGSGYLPALLALMADRVYSVERVRELSARARKALDGLELRNNIACYDAPDDLLEATDSKWAREGSDELESFTKGLRATDQGDPANLTLTGHSYGTTMVGTAATTEGVVVAVREHDEAHTEAKDEAAEVDSVHERRTLGARSLPSIARTPSNREAPK
jgi:SAM-dependent methyltransferase